MKLFRLSAAVAALWILARFLPAQTPVGYTQVSAANLTDSSGVKIANGTIAFAPVNNAGQPISYQINGNGQSHSLPVTTLVTNGAMTIQLADTSLTVPVNVCFSVTITDNTNGNSLLGPGYTCFQPAGSGIYVANGVCTAATSGAGGTCNFDKFPPNLPGLVVQQTGPTGPAPNMAVGSTTTMAPGASATVTIDGTNPNYNLHFGIPQGVVGPTGATGATGPMGPTGPLGPTGPPGGSLSYPGCTSDGSNGFQCPTGNVQGGQVGGVTYAKAAQTGSGGNGIVNSIGYGKTVSADPSYLVSTLANMTLGSNSITVAAPAGIIAGMYVSGNVPQGTIVLTVTGNVITLSAGALSTNATANINFFENPYRSYVGALPPASNFTLIDEKLGWRNNIKRDPGENAYTNHTDFNFNHCISTKRQGWFANGAGSGGGSNETCFGINAWFAAPTTNYGTIAQPGIWPGNWGVATLLSVGDTVPQTGIAELITGVHGKSGIGDGPLGYLYYADYLGSVAGSDEGQGGLFISGGEAQTTTTGTVATGGGGAGTQSLSIACVTDCSSAAGLSAAGPGDGRYMVDKASPVNFNMMSRTIPAGQTPGTMTIDTAIPASTFWGTIGWGVTGNLSSGSATVTALSSTTGYAAGQPITGTGIPVGTTISSVNTGASSLVMSKNATASGSAVVLGIGDVITPTPPPNANGVPMSSGTTNMTFTVNSGTLNLPYSLGSVTNASAGTTTYINTNSSGMGGICATPGTTSFTVTGFTNSANNGTFTCASSTVFTLTLNNSSGVAETHAGTATASFANTGSPAIGDLVCFSWPSHEQATITAVSGTGPWVVTVPLRMPHNATSWMFSNGGCGSFSDFTANDVAPQGGTPAVTLHYPFDIIGSVNSTTLVPVWFSTYNINTNAQGAVPLYPLSNVQVPIPLYTGEVLTNSGGTVTITGTGSPSLTGQSQFFYQSSIYISGATDSAFNGVCTNTLPNSFNQLTCTQASSIGHGSVTNTGYGSIAVGTTGYGNTAGVLWKGAEVLDILDYVEANCAAAITGGHAPCYDGKNITLEPNGAAWANGDPIEEPHHYSSQIKASKQPFWAFNPYQQDSVDGWIYGITGPGACCGTFGNPTSNRAIMSLGNGNLAAGMYQGHGGTAMPPGALVLGGGVTTGMGFLYGVMMANAPEPNGIGTALYVGCPTLPWQCGDPTYSYKAINLAGSGQGGVISYNPFYNEMTIGNGNPLVWNGDLNGVTMHDGIKFAVLATPTVTVTPLTTGGVLADGTYCYYVLARNSLSQITAAPTENCKTITGGGGNGSVKLSWTRISGATSYYLCGRTTAAELQVLNLPGVDSTYYTDTGGVTPSGSCAFTATLANPIIDQAGQVNFNSLGTSFEVAVKAPASLATTPIVTLPSITGTLALTSQITPVRAGGWTITAATSVGVTFATAFPSTPASCAITPTSDPTAVGAIWMTALTTTGMTVNVHTSGTISGTYQCVGGSTTRRRRPVRRPAPRPPAPAQQRR